MTAYVSRDVVCWTPHKLSLIRKPPLVAVFLFNKHKCIVSIHWTPCLFFNFGRIQAKYHHQFLLSFLPFFLVCLKAHGNHRIAHKLKLHDTSPKLSTTLTLSCSAMYSSILKILVHGNICKTWFPMVLGVMINYVFSYNKIQT